MLSSIKPALTTQIGRRFLFHTLWLSFAVSLVSFSIILVNDYQRGTEHIRSNLQQIEDSYKPSLSDSAWTFDETQLKAQLKGILNFEGVTQVSVMSAEMGTLSAGDPTAQAELVYRFPLEHISHNETVKLGQVVVKANFEPVVTELTDKALNIILVEFFKTLAISLSLMLIFHQIVTRHLLDLSTWAEALSLSNLDRFPKLNRSHQARDELDSLSEAMTKMCETLTDEILKQQLAQQEVEDARNHLALAIDNASLGFCRYISNQKKIIPNGHFCRQLRISEHDLKALEDPLQELMGRMEETRNSEQKERVRQLLQGRIQRVQGNFHLRKFNNQDGVFHITFQSISYQDNRPDELLICCVDKTAEHN